MALSTRFYIPEKVVPFCILSIEGLPKSGKTRLAAGAPGKVAVQSLDFGTDGVLQSFPDYENRFIVAEYKVEMNVLADAAMQAMARVGAKKDKLKEEAYRYAEETADRVRRNSLDPFIQDYYDLLDEPDVRTIVWDTATEVNEMIRLAHHGKLEKNPKIAYGPINAEFKGLVKRASEKRKNLVMIHHLTEVYVNDIASGKMKLKGNNNVEGLVHSFIRIEKKVKDGKAKFITTIRDSRFAPAAQGKTIEGADWVMLMEELMPEVEAEAWL